LKKIAALFAIMVATGITAAACSSKSDSGSSATSTATDAAMPAATPHNVAIDTGPPEAPKGKLPIPLAKLPSMTVAAGSVTNGAKLFAANCESCHGASGKNGQVGPTLYGMGFKAGQVAFMVRKPAAVDVDSSMPKLTITDKELADISAYVASLK
jgi:mono/diheme cytochrome c family protein